MDWVHCNECFTQPGFIVGRKFVITNCGHIYCAECIRIGKVENCNICKAKFTSIPLTPSMNPKVEVYFQDPIEMLQKQVKILEFQNTHRLRLVESNTLRLANYNNLKEENYSLKEQVKHLSEENMVLKEDVKRKMKELNYYRMKKCDYLAKQGQERRRQTSPFDNTMFTPNTEYTRSNQSLFSQRGDHSSAEECDTVVLKRPQGSSVFFEKSTAFLDSQSQKKDHMFTPPLPPSFSGGYRCRSSTPLGVTPVHQSPITPPESVGPRDPLQRKVKLPGDRGGPSPVTKIGLQRLSLSRPSNAGRETLLSVNKYSKYH